MTYSLDTLTSPRVSATGSSSAGFGRFAVELALLAGVLVLGFWLLALLTYSPQDAAWSTSGGGMALANRSGRLGAWLADASYYLFGFSAWWLMALGLRAWLAGLAAWLRHDAQSTAPADQSLDRHPWLRRRGTFWLGLVMLVCASCLLEWTRMYSFEARLPDASGGVLGSVLGPVALRWLGFTGSGLVAILIGLVGAALAFRFSWGTVAERIGAAIHTRLENRRKKREVVEDKALGQRAAREREEVVSGERVEIREHHPAPVQVEPVVLEIPKSERVAKERQKPLFTEMLDSKLPQVDLLDAAQIRQETVSPEMLDMTSRMIEKKLKDFGVEVWVVLALPGPVITRYEIEPAVGVKGSQIVGLAKDLARSLSLVSIRVVETIPGKNYMALELPNAKRQSIRLSEILGSRVYNEAKSMLTMGLGKDIVGNPVVADLAKMP
ncbi:MAG TPA: DNA translocase FtsK 4TM domain-containing protein, partial [Burkholderiaceae bacterium]|nr:DNA translocase FtsK 4TM domain-containing protein [Burkholderiaceae bacterium]